MIVGRHGVWIGKLGVHYGLRPYHSERTGRRRVVRVGKLSFRWRTR